MTGGIQSKADRYAGEIPMLAMIVCSPCRRTSIMPSTVQSPTIAVIVIGDNLSGLWPPRTRRNDAASLVIAQSLKDRVVKVLAIKPLGSIDSECFSVGSTPVKALTPAELWNDLP